MKNLVIVESPAKAKTIEKYLGSDFTVLSSVGHIRSIVKKTKDGKPPIDVKNGFETVYEVDSDKTKIISGLKKAVKTAETVWLATDEDREGEAIAWHLCEVLKLDPKKTKRIVFHEITKNAIDEAIRNPRHIDMDLVKAQQARQILDRLVGFELSPVVWRKVPGGKSAGRVQSPAVRLLVERENEINKFSGQTSFKVTAEFKHNGDTIKSELSEKFPSEDEAKQFLESLIGATYKVSDITKSPAVRNPSAPFTTSTLQQEANSRLGFSAKATMSSAQKLYQEGKITYMRTDSITLSQQILAQAASFIKEKYGEKYSQVRNFKTKSASAQEAHEAIRPTNLALEKASSNEYEQKLYDLIRRRTLASQMTPAKIEKTIITIDISGTKLIFEAKGEVIIFDGFLKLYGTSKFEADVLPAVAKNDELEALLINAKQMFSRPPARYSEGSLVKKLEDLGIGRPSTYATIINTVQVRGYAEKGSDEGQPRDVISLTLKNQTINREIIQEKTGSNKGKLVPTPAGEVVSGFLTDHFTQIVDYGFTAGVESYFDKIADGKLDRNKMLSNFYEPFHKLVQNSGEIDRSSVTKAREIGKDPKTNKTIIARFGRFGPMLQLGEVTEEGEKPQFAPMPAGKKIETITIDDALHAFKLPRLVGKTPDGQEIKANIGRFGPYIQVGKLFVNIKSLDPHTISLEEAIEFYNDKLQSEKDKNIAEFDNGIKVIKGRFGPYITDGKNNVKIPKDIDPKSIDKDKATSLLESAPKTTKKRSVRRKKSSK
jgi:DNA topoisomerase I